MAKLALVSPAAVSRYLNNQLSLPQETVNRIENAIRDLSFVPNAIARRLSRQSSETFGFVTSDIVYPFFASIASAAEDEASRHGFSLTIFNSRNDVAKELQFLRRVEDRQVDGMLFMTNHLDDGQLRDKINSSGRVVLIDEDIAGAVAPRLFAENALGGELATRHLIEKGHSRIAYIGGPKGLISVDERLQGYQRALAVAGIPVDPALVHYGSYDTDVARRAFHNMWNSADRPTAVFAGGDLMAMGVMHAALDFGLQVPRDFSIVSFDDMPHAALFSPPLTTIRQSTEEFGRRGIQLLLRYLRSGETSQNHPRIGVELIVRQSVGKPPAVGGPSRRSRRRRSA